MRRNLTRLLSALLFTIACPSFAVAQAQPAPEAAIRTVIDAQVAAWNRGDIPGFMDGYWRSDSLVFVSSRGLTRGWQPVLERYQRSYPDRQSQGILQIDLLDVRLLAPDVVFAIGRWSLKRLNGTDTGHTSLLFRRQPDGQWRIVADHSS